MDQLRPSLKEVEERLAQQLDSRERLLKETRDVIAACSRAIIDVHLGKRAEAKRELESARSKLKPLREAGQGQLARYLVSPETEYVEASSIIALSGGRSIPTRARLGVSPEAYLLGLLDSVGELKRLVLDCIMKGNISAARTHFSSMERLYSACSPLAVYDHVASGTRRKVDVARMLVEDVRGIMAEESRRESASEHMRRLERKLSRATAG